MRQSSVANPFSETEAPSVVSGPVASPQPVPTSKKRRQRRRDPASSERGSLRFVNHFCKNPHCEHNDHNCPVDPRVMLKRGLNSLCPKGCGPTLVPAGADGMPPWYAIELGLTTALFKRTFPSKGAGKEEKEQSA